MSSVHGQRLSNRPGSTPKARRTSDLDSGELPPIDLKQERLQNQLNTLREEQNYEVSGLRSLQKSMSDSVMLIEKADQQAAQTRMEYTMHMRHVFEMEQNMKKVRDDLGHRASRMVDVRRATSASSSSSRMTPKQRSAQAQKLALCASLDWVTLDHEPPRRLGKRPAAEDSEAFPEEYLEDMQRSRLRHALIVQALFLRAKRHHDAVELCEAEKDLKLLIEKDPQDDDAKKLLEAVRQQAEDLKQELAKRQQELKEKREERRLDGDQPLAGLEKKKWDEEVACVQQLKHLNWVATKESEHEKPGGAREAFRFIDLNGSGHISLQEFAHGCTRLGVDWQDITGLKGESEIFRLFDQDKDSALDFKELFPVEAKQAAQPKRPSTPEFWHTWCRENNDEEFEKRIPYWLPADRDEDWRNQLNKQYHKEEGESHSRWISSRFRHLKVMGKTDAQARQNSCIHLPHGKGPKDREGCRFINEENISALRKSYNESTCGPSKRISKSVYDMRDTRRVLQGFRQQLFQITMEPTHKQRQEDERRAEEQRKAEAKGSSSGVMAAMGLAGGFKKAPKEGDADKEERNGTKTASANFAKELSLSEATVNHITSEFMKVQDANELAPKNKFREMLEVLIGGGRELADKEVDQWWSAAKEMPYAEDHIAQERAKAKLRKNTVNLEQFLAWFAEDKTFSMHVILGS